MSGMGLGCAKTPASFLDRTSEGLEKAGMPP
jgi:hypothetical protein